MKVGDLVRLKDALFPEDDPASMGIVTIVDGGISSYDGEPWESYCVRWWHRNGSDTLWYEKGELEIINET